jgi:hypothetical protein
LTVGFEELSCAVSGTLQSNMTVPTTSMDTWEIFFVIIPFSSSVHRLISLIA